MRTEVTEENLDPRTQEILVGQASTMSYQSFVRAADYWKQLADDDGAEEDDQKRRDRRERLIPTAPSPGCGSER